MTDFHKNDGIQAVDSSAHDTLHGWIRANIIPRKTPNLRETSYGLKHRFEAATGCYIDNEAFKRAMLECGFAPVNVTEQNHRYCISSHSPALRHRCI